MLLVFSCFLTDRRIQVWPQEGQQRTCCGREVGTWRNRPEWQISDFHGTGRQTRCRITSACDTALGGPWDHDNDRRMASIQEATGHGLPASHRQPQPQLCRPTGPERPHQQHRRPVEPGQEEVETHVWYKKGRTSFGHVLTGVYVAASISWALFPPYY